MSNASSGFSIQALPQIEVRECPDVDELKKCLQTIMGTREQLMSIIYTPTGFVVLTVEQTPLVPNGGSA